VPLRARLDKLLEYAGEAGYDIESSGGRVHLRFYPPPSPSWGEGAAIHIVFSVEEGYALLEDAWLETGDGRVRIEEELLAPWLLCIDPGPGEGHKEY